MVGIVYSVTVSIAETDAEEWLAWMLEEHIPQVMATGCFEAYTLHRLLEPIEDPDFATYNIQYQCGSLDMYEQYRKVYAPQLQAETYQRYGERVYSFRTLLERL